MYNRHTRAQGTQPKNAGVEVEHGHIRRPILSQLDFSFWVWIGIPLGVDVVQ
eukprot:m.136916 g.136916  ORF g.136916 m.136916 type:complete len:52 (-) comp29893_c5_seq1:3-158(-)